jgi:hypothetical protein
MNGRINSKIMVRLECFPVRQARTKGNTTVTVHARATLGGATGVLHVGRTKECAISDS